MARYIDREAVLNALKEEREKGNFVFTTKWIKEIMDNIPTADVAPKSEVASMPHKCKDCAGCTQWKCDCSLIEDNAKTEVAREIFEEIERCTVRKVIYQGKVLYDTTEQLAELKKKYIGE